MFLSPPWGGPAYMDKDTFDIDTMTPAGSAIFQAASKVSPNIAYFLPKNTDVAQVH